MNPIINYGLLLLGLLNFGCQPHTTAPDFEETSKGIYRITDPDMSLTVDANIGGRMVSLMVDGHELLAQKSENKYAFGSTFWPSPHFPGWPLPADYDRTPWEAELNGNQIQLTGPVIENLGLQFRKYIDFVPGENSIHCRYIIYNRTDTAIKVAPWEVTRLKREGRWLVAAEKNSFNTKKALKDLHSDFDSGLYSCLISENYNGKSQKISLNASEAWFVYLNDHLIFLKLFDDITENKLVPKAGDVEFYIDGNTDYMELETQGNYETLEAEDSLSYQTHWIVKPRNEVFKSGGTPAKQDVAGFARKLLESNK